MQLAITMRAVPMLAPPVACDGAGQASGGGSSSSTSTRNGGNGGNGGADCGCNEEHQHQLGLVHTLSKRAASLTRVLEDSCGAASMSAQDRERVLMLAAQVLRTLCEAAGSVHEEAG